MNWQNVEFFKLLRQSSLFEKILLIVLQIAACVLPFTLIMLLTLTVYWIYFNAILWLSSVALAFIYKFAKQRRTGQHVEISIIPTFNKK